MKKEIKKNNIQRPIEKRIGTVGRRREDYFYKIIFDNVPVSIITIDKEGNITSSNKYFRNFYDIKDDSKHNIFKDKFFKRENLIDDFKRMLSTGETLRRYHFHDVNNKEKNKYFKIIAVPFRNSDGAILGAVSLASDDTDIVESKNNLIEFNNSLEEKVSIRTKELDKANKELSRSMEMKSVFLSDISHEFRTSLTIMQCNLELLSLSLNLSGENAELYKNVISEIKRVANMLSSLSELNKIDYCGIKFKSKKMNLNILIASVLDNLKKMAGEKKVKIEHRDHLQKIFISAVKDDIEKLVMNLISNAIKYNREGGWVEISAEKKEGGVDFKVEDGGIGIPENEIKNIFERFYRVDKSRTRNGVDSGLGLAICKHIAELYGGNISVSSKLGKGSIFTVFLPDKF